MLNLPKDLPNFQQASILVVGDLMLDRYWFGDTLRISPEAPVPIVQINNQNHRPGGAGNVALNLAAYGCRVDLLGITGDDEAGSLLRHQLENAKVNTHIILCNKAETIIKLRVISRHQQLLRIDFEKNVADHHQDELDQRFEKLLENKNLVVLSDYKKGTLAQPQKIIAAAKRANIPVIVDPKGTNFGIYQHATMITPNFKEFEAVVGHCENETAIITKARNLLTDINISTILVTRGEHGMTLIDQQQVTHFPAYAREVIDITGAGDTVIATLGAALAAGSDQKESTALANLAASLSVGKFGAATISPPELKTSLAGKNNYMSGVVNEEQLINIIKEVKTNGKKIVFTNGCFDILHAGHVTYLQLAKQLGDYLIVAINDDDSIRRQKGPNRPINNLDHRMTVLACLEVVDWVIPFSDDTPERLLSLLQPHCLAKGTDYQLHQVVGADIVQAYGGEVRIINHSIDNSSTKIYNRIHEANE